MAYVSERRKKYLTDTENNTSNKTEYVSERRKAILNPEPQKVNVSNDKVLKQIPKEDKKNKFLINALQKQKESALKEKNASLPTTKTTQTTNSVGVNDFDQEAYNRNIAKVEKVPILGPLVKNAINLQNKYFNSPVGRFAERTSGAIKEGLTGGQVENKPTTGNKVADTAADIGGNVFSYFAPIGGGAGAERGMISATDAIISKAGKSQLAQNALKTAENKLGQTATRIGAKALKGSVEGLAGTAQEAVTKPMTKEELRDSAITNALGGASLSLFGDATGQIIRNVKAGKTLSATEQKIISEAAQKEPAIANVLNDNLGIKKPNNINTRPILESQPTMANKSIAEDVGLSGKNIPRDSKLKVELNESPMNGTDFTIRSSNERKTAKNIFESAYSKLVDTNDPIKKIGEDPFIKATNAKKVGGSVDYILKEGLTDMNGTTIGKSLQEINKSIPKNKENEFWQYMLHKLNPQRLAQDKKLGNVSAETSLKRVAEIETANPEFKTVAQDVRKFIDTFMDEWGVKSGLISKDALKEMRATYPDYIPAQRFFDEIEKSSGSIGKGSFVDQTSNIKSAKGSERDIINPLENIMNMVNKTVRSAKFNEVGQSLLDAIRKNPKTSEIAEILEPKEGMFSNLDNVVSVLEDGNPVYLKIYDKTVLDAMKQLNNPNFQEWQQAAKKVTGAFKALITTKNPLFAVRNMFRDIPTSYIYGSTMNPVKFTKDLLVAGKDVAINSKAYRQYKALGGQGGNFFNVDDITKTANQLSKGRNVFQKIGDGIEWFNNLTESAPRLAEFKRTLAKTGDANQALFQSGEVTTNFSRGGNVTKQIDSFTPYFNAGVQGLDRLFRALDPRNPKQAMQTLLKGGIAITVPTVFFEYINRDNDNYKNLDNRTKDNYFLIPNGDTFIKIPKSREFGVLFSSLFQRLYRANQGDSKAFKGFGSTVATSFAPANPIEDNIFSGYINMKNNKDFAGRDIVPQSMQDLPNRLQRDERTSTIATGFADAANELSKRLNLDRIGLGFELSPKQVNYLIDSYTGVIGDFVLPATTPQGGTGAQNIKEKLLSPVKSAFTADPLYNNQAVTDFYDNLNDITKIANARNIDENIDSKVLTEEEKTKGKLTKASKELTQINKKIKELSLVGTEASKNEIKQLRAKYLQTAMEANKYYESIKK